MGSFEFSATEKGKRTHSRCEPWDNDDNEDALKTLGTKGRDCDLGGLITHLYSNPARWWSISNNDMKDKVVEILLMIR